MILSCCDSSIKRLPSIKLVSKNTKHSNFHACNQKALPFNHYTIAIGLMGCEFSSSNKSGFAIIKQVPEVSFDSMHSFSMKMRGHTCIFFLYDQDTSNHHRQHIKKARLHDENCGSRHGLIKFRV